ncbi:MAG TPA: TolC family protein [Candidatus Binatia bacterium]|nr:TolC family protein [Candidatus Binatia bacterium]
MQRYGNRTNTAVRVARAVARSSIRLTTPLLTALNLAAMSVEAQQPIATARISLERAIELALERNHALQAVRTTIQQSEAEEITADLRPNPVFSRDYSFIPLLSPSYFGTPWSEVPLPQEGDASLAYTLELGHKRQACLAAAKDRSAVTRSTVVDNERNFAFQVASQFIGVLLAESSLDFAQQDLKNFQKTVEVSAQRYKAGDISQGDLLKIQLQMLQFQTDVSTAQLNRIQSLAALWQLLGFESVPDEYDVDGELDYQPVRARLDELTSLALRSRPDLRAAQLSTTSTQSQYRLARAEGKPDLIPQVGYSHAGDEHTVDFAFNIALPIFSRNQGEVAHSLRRDSVAADG